MALTTSVLYDGPVAVVVLEGELDLAVTEPVDAAVTGALAAGYRSLVLDASRLAFCDSCGLGAIVRGHRAVQAVGGQLRVAGAHGSFARLLELSAMDRLLTLVPDVGQALMAARPRPTLAPAPADDDS